MASSSHVSSSSLSAAATATAAAAAAAATARAHAAGAIIKFEALARGAGGGCAAAAAAAAADTADASPCPWSCFVLEVDDFAFLLDCGWDARFDAAALPPGLIRRVQARQLDAVLISQSDIAHLGALPYIVGTLGLDIPIFSTIPVHKMGQMFMYDAHESAGPDFSVFSLDDVDAAFDRFVQLKYLQRFEFDGKGAGISIVPQPSGHQLGGTVWQIRKETEEILHASVFNHKSERHLGGTTLTRMSHPSLLIAGTHALAAGERVLSRRQRDTELTDAVVTTLDAGGNVLIPTDPAGRALELLLLLEQHWSEKRLRYSVAFLTHVSFNTVEFAKSMLEWMSDAVMNAFEATRENPLAFRHVRLCHDRDELDALPQPVCIVASSAGMEIGSFSKELFVELAASEHNLVVFPQRTPHSTLAEKLRAVPTPRVVDVEFRERVELEGEELEEHNRLMESQETQRRLAQEDGGGGGGAAAAAAAGTAGSQPHAPASDAGDAAAAAGGAVAAADADGADDGEDSDVEDETDPFITRMPFQHSFDMFAQEFALEGFKYPLFPFLEKRAIVDDFGEAVFASEFAAGGDTGAGGVGGGGGEADDARAHVSPGAPLGLALSQATAGVEAEARQADPVKYMTSVVSVDVHCRVMCIDFEGRADARSMKAILQNVAPRRIILVHAGPEESALLSGLGQKSQLTVAAPGVPVDVTSDSAIFKVRLKEGLLNSLRFFENAGYNLAHVCGRIHVTPSAVDETDTLTLEGLPPEEASADVHDAVMVGEVKLNSFKRALADAGFHSDLAGGVLITANGTVSLRREESGRLCLEGVISEDYFKVRSVLYSLYTFV